MIREECRRRQGAAFFDRQLSRSSSKGSKTRGRRLSATMSMGNGIPLQLDGHTEPSTRRSSNAMKHSISRRGSLTGEPQTKTGAGPPAGVGRLTHELAGTWHRSLSGKPKGVSPRASRGGSRPSSRPPSRPPSRPSSRPASRRNSRSNSRSSASLSMQSGEVATVGEGEGGILKIKGLPPQEEILARKQFRAMSVDLSTATLNIEGIKSQASPGEESPRVEDGDVPPRQLTEEKRSASQGDSAPSTKQSTTSVEAKPKLSSRSKKQAQDTSTLVSDALAKLEALENRSDAGSPE